MRGIEEKGAGCERSVKEEPCAEIKGKIRMKRDKIS